MMFTKHFISRSNHSAKFYLIAATIRWVLSCFLTHTNDPKKLYFLFLLISNISYTQIHFESIGDWQKILAKAKQENKYVFVDAFTTWCSPCKQMDQNVYRTAEAGAFYNQNFVCIKLQLDQTTNDDQYVHDMYKNAAEFKLQYQVNAFPAYLFFNSDGLLTYRDVGAKPLDEFLAMGKIATYTEDEVIKKIATYRAGQIDYTLLPAIIVAAKKDQQYKLADSAARDYLYGYLEKLPENILTSKNNLDWLGSNLSIIKPRTRIFRLISKQPKIIDSLKQEPGFAEWARKKIIYDNELWNKVWLNGKPIEKIVNWLKLEKQVIKNYPNLDVKPFILRAQIDFYNRLKDWPTYVYFKDKEFKSRKLIPTKEKTAPGYPDAWMLNVAAWDVFLQATDSLSLNKALDWINTAFSLEENPNVQFFDTKANLLYKLGKKSEAIQWERRGLIVDQEYAIDHGRTIFTDEYLKIIEKMIKGEPTWPVANK
jgi:thiol-disulfide isomerase/thioredoxin